jgi:epoxyqueuosine reductase
MHSSMPAISVDGVRDPLVADLRVEAARIGFSRLGIAPAEPPHRQDLFRRWLDSGFAGVMRGWLEQQAPLRADPGRLLDTARSVIMLATDYSTVAGLVAVPCPPGQGRVSRYAWGGDYHDLLRTRSNLLGEWLERRVPGCRTRGVVDSAPLAEREFAWRAGLGWFGKNTMLIHPGRDGVPAAGSYFFLTAVLTDLALPTDVPPVVDHCGTCTACLDACPTGALVEPRVLDASRCISTLTIEDRGTVAPELRVGMGDWIFGCDVCQEVCPWNRHAPLSSEPTFRPRAADGGEKPAAPTLGLAELLGLDEPAFRRRFKGSPLLRAKRSGLLRSAAIALGNRPDAAAGDALVAAVADPDPVVRSAAAWALGRWRRAGGPLATTAHEALARRLPLESDAGVREELVAALA